ncbi:Bbp19 family protein [Arboricoccus pini]|nr:hypothetical protein [Arboricoccus pini]
MDDLPVAFARCFSGTEGHQVLTALRRLYLERRLVPSARDAELWHLEGQRSVVAHIIAMIERGRAGLGPAKMSIHG